MLNNGEVMLKAYHGALWWVTNLCYVKLLYQIRILVWLPAIDSPLLKDYIANRWLLHNRKLKRDHCDCTWKLDYRMIQTH